MSKPKRIPHKQGYKYRICRDCDYEYNVSQYDEHGRVYYCPTCEKKRRRKR